MKRCPFRCTHFKRVVSLLLDLASTIPLHNIAHCMCNISLAVFSGLITNPCYRRHLLAFSILAFISSVQSLFSVINVSMCTSLIFRSAYLLQLKLFVVLTNFHKLNFVDIERKRERERDFFRFFDFLCRLKLSYLFSGPLFLCMFQYNTLLQPPLSFICLCICHNSKISSVIRSSVFHLVVSFFFRFV